MAIEVLLLPYWFLFAAWSIGALQSGRLRTSSYRILFYGAGVIITTLMIGLRFEVGGDWGQYLRIYENIYFLSLKDSLEITDPGYVILNQISGEFNAGIIIPNLVCAILLMSGIASLAWRQPNPFLAMTVAVPYLIIVVAMGYTRQAAAIGIIFFAVSNMKQESILKFSILIFFAALFHKTAVLMLPIALVPVFKRNVIFGAVGIVIFLVLFVLLLNDSSDRLITNYIQGNYDSQGATIRITMNVLAAALFLLFRERFEMPKFQASFFTTSAVIALISPLGLVIASATSGIDRISLYFIPLQIVAFSHLPMILSKNRAINLPSVTIAVILYYFMIQFVWLNYANNAEYWLPYKVIFQDDQGV